LFALIIWFIIDLAHSRLFEVAARYW